MPLSDLPAFVRLPDHVNIMLTPMQLLAVAGALRTMDDGLLDEEGIIASMHPHIQTAFEVFECETENLFGIEWIDMVSTPERLQEELDAHVEGTSMDDDGEPV